MSPLDILRAHFEAQRRRRFAVPNPAGGEIVLYHDPISLQDMLELETHRPKGAGEMYVQAIILKACTEDGQPVFTAEDAYALRRQVSAAVVMGLGEAILDTGPGALALGERSGGRNAHPSAPPSSSPTRAESPLPTLALASVPPPQSAGTLDTP